MSHSHAEQLPRGALIISAALVITALTATSIARLIGLPPAAQPAAVREADHAGLVSQRSLTFVDRADGAVVIADRSTGAIAQTIAPGTNSGFIRGVLRGFARDRRLRGLGGDQPFTLSLWQDGQLTLTDSATGRTVELGAFGVTNRDAFINLLNRQENK
ncbi:photosynthetic complex assembly protein PuhC [Sphingomonas sp.]|uniref:photosynthetic complex assembly protein PuhC n=1 Tax=Sphingomonas sp. TaxID=28214 RepID=UPI001DDA8E69|nr:photosynthetic complex assembly protein PuhC [Sphingomonas sp.]MBX9796830.1 phosphonoacetaldehyde methylase [Sphingomonas sp.]